MISGPAVLRELLFQIRIEAIGFDQRFKREVHSVLPIVFRIGRDVDSLIRRVGSANVRVHAEQILKLKDAPHRWGSKMLLDDGLINPRLTIIRRFARQAELLVVEALGDAPVFFPPTPDGAHVVGGRGDHAQVRRASRI